MGRITPEVKIEEDETAKMKTFSFPLLPAVNIMVAEIAPWPKWPRSTILDLVAHIRCMLDKLDDFRDKVVL